MLLVDPKVGWFTCDTIPGFGKFLLNCAGISYTSLFFTLNIAMYNPKMRKESLQKGLQGNGFFIFEIFQSSLQNVAAGFTALTVYILICMTFIAMAMMYYGLTDSIKFEKDHQKGTNG